MHVGGWVGGGGDGEAGVKVEHARCPHSFCPFIPENMAKEEVAKPVVGNDSGTCKASFAGDVDAFIDQERRRPTTLRYRRSFYHKPCRLEIEGRLLCDSSSTSCESKVFWVLGGVWSQAET